METKRGGLSRGVLDLARKRWKLERKREGSDDGKSIGQCGKEGKLDLLDEATV